MTFTVEIFESIEQINQDAWDQLVKDRPFANSLWLRVTENVLVTHQPRYILLRQADELKAGAICLLQSRFQSPLLQFMLGWYIRRFPGLRCGIPISYHSGLIFHPESSPGDWLPALVQGIQKLIQRDHVSFYTIDHLSPADAVWTYLQTRGYHRIEHLPEVYLDVQWESFEDYLTQLPKKKRKEYVRIKGRLERENITIETASLQNQDQRALQRLVNNVFERHKEPTLYQSDLFLTANALMGEDFKLIVAHQSGQLIGCIALLRNGSEWMIKWPGLDYERALDTGTYYGLLAECVRQTIQSGGTRLHLGATAYQTKQHFGVTVENKIGALAFPNPVAHYLAGKMLQLTARLNLSWPIPEASLERKSMSSR
jgi:predicted N-acyltransferase